MGLGTVYLLAYNGTLLVGWSLILVQLARHYAAGGDAASLYPVVRRLLVVSQSAAVLEIVHALVGLVRSPVFTTTVQVFSRILVLWGGLELGSKSVTEDYFASQMIAAWAASEILRYSFYFLGLLGKESIPKLLTWARYSGFMVLYPLGITGEIVCLYNALPFIKANRPYTVTMPNAQNFAFDYYGFVWFTLLGMYPYGSWVMYTYMLSQRRKVLGGGSKKDKRE